jgi:hypothetical protein
MIRREPKLYRLAANAGNYRTGGVLVQNWNRERNQFGITDLLLSVLKHN